MELFEEDEKHNPLCVRLMKFGSCTNNLCNARHVIQNTIDKPRENVLPLIDNVVRLEIKTVYDATHYKGNIIGEDKIVGNCKGFISDGEFFGELLKRYFANSANRKCIENVSIGDIVAYEEHGNIFHKARVTRIKYDEMLKKMVINAIRILDIEIVVVNPPNDKIFVLPDVFKSMPCGTFAEIIVCNLLPVAAIEWSSDVTKFIKKRMEDWSKLNEGYFKAKIILSVGNYIFLEDLNYVKITGETVDLSVQSLLLENQMAIENSRHVDQIMQCFDPSCSLSDFFLHIASSKATSSVDSVSISVDSVGSVGAVLKEQCDDIAEENAASSIATDSDDDDGGYSADEDVSYDQECECSDKYSSLEAFFTFDELKRYYEKNEAESKIMNEFSLTKDSALDQHDYIDAGNDCPIVDTDKDNRKVSGEYSAISVNHCDDESAVSANQKIGTTIQEDKIVVHPISYWWQRNRDLYLKIPLTGIDSCQVDCTEDTLRFSTILFGDKQCNLEFELYLCINARKTTYVLNTFDVTIHMRKLIYWDWKSFTKTKNLSVKYNPNYILTPFDSEEDTDDDAIGLKIQSAPFDVSKSDDRLSLSDDDDGQCEELNISPNLFHLE